MDLHFYHLCASILLILLRKEKPFEPITGKDLAMYRLNSTEERLKAARLLLERQMYTDAVSRSYYAVFQAARAVLATKELDSRKHSGIIGLFNQQFVKTGILPKDYGKNPKKR